MHAKALNLIPSFNYKPVFLVLFSLFLNAFAFCQNNKKYNVLLILADDMNQQCSILGFPQLKTPNLERLAAHGINFTNAFTQFPLCNPSRTSVLTGWRPDKTKVFDNSTSPRQMIGNSKKFLPEYFHDFGYRTERYGKIMHPEFAKECSWDNQSLYPAGGKEDKNLSLTSPGQWWVSTQNDTVKVDGRACRQTDSTLRISKSQPFFIALGLQTPHAPFSPGIKSWNTYGELNVQELLPINSDGDFGTLKGNGSSNISLPATPANDRLDIPQIEFVGGPTMVYPDADLKRIIHAYYAEVTEMDMQLGRVLDALDDGDLWSNTIVIFTSDNGQHLGEHEGMWYKNDLFNESLHMPFIICAPGIKAGVCNKLVELVDIFPTLTDICGLPEAAEMQGISLLPLLVNPNLNWKKNVFSQLLRGTSYMGRAVVSNRFHYNYWGTGNNIPELYDRINDPFEYTNLAIDSLYTDSLTIMKAILDSGWAKALPPSKDSVLFFRDADGDGYGNINQYKFAYSTPTGYVKDWNDCNDSDVNIHPGALEICDGIDNDCNGIIDLMPSVSADDHPFFCLGFFTTLSVNYPDSNHHYQWRKNGVNITGATAQAYNVTDTGHYSVREFIDAGCSAISPVIYISRKSLPKATVTPSENLNLCDTGAVLLTANEGDGYAYQWLWGIKMIKTNGNGQTFIPRAGGNYQVIVTNRFGCSDTSEVVIVTNVCTDAASFSIYPNPSAGFIKISYESLVGGVIKLLVRGVSGKLFAESSYAAQPGKNIITMNLSELNKGSYFLTLIDDSNILHEKFQIIK